MATRPDTIPEKCTIVYRTVETSTTVTVGAPVKDGNADGECQPLGGTTELPIGVVVSIGGNPAVTAGAAGDRVGVALLNGGVAPVKVGAGGATRGQSALYISATAVGDAVPSDTTPVYAWCIGYFTQTGASGDMVGCALLRHTVTQ